MACPILDGNYLFFNEGRWLKGKNTVIDKKTLDKVKSRCLSLRSSAKVARTIENRKASPIQNGNETS